MNRKRIFAGLSLLVALLSLPAVVTATDTETESEYEYKNLTIQMGGEEDSLNFTWWTYDPTDCVLAFDDAREFHSKRSKKRQHPQQPEFVYGEMDTVYEDDTYSCKVTVDNLRNNSKYVYVIGNGEEFSDAFSFETGNSNNFNFIFVGDPQIGSSNDVDTDGAGWETTVSAALEKFKKTSFILSAGDQVNSADSEEEYDAFFNAEELTSVPFSPAIGNHDTSDLYAQHFTVPNESDEYGITDGGGDYWFTYGDTLFMVLNTNNDSATSHSYFMDEAIESNPQAKWRVLVFHHSIYSSASHVEDVNDLRTSMFPEIDERDIDIVLSGHDHFYARSYQLSGAEVVGEVTYTDTFTDRRTGEEVTKTVTVDTAGEPVSEEEMKFIGNAAVLNPEGTVYFTANSASGSKYYDFTDIDGYTNYYLAAYEQLETPTYLNVEINESTLRVSAYRVDTDEMVDSYAIVKKKINKKNNLRNN